MRSILSTGGYIRKYRYYILIGIDSEILRIICGVCVGAKRKKRIMRHCFIKGIKRIKVTHSARAYLIPSFHPLISNGVTT